MSNVRDQQKQQGGQGGRQQAGGGQKIPPLPQEPSQKPEHRGQGQQRHGSGHMSSDQISFYDETLKKELQGSFKSDGRSIHVFSTYGTKSASYSDLGACIDYNAQVSLAQKLLSELACAAGGDHQQQAPSQQTPMRRPVQAEVQGGFSQGGVGTPP
jgi:hypothetical protein